MKRLTLTAAAVFVVACAGLHWQAHAATTSCTVAMVRAHGCTTAAAVAARIAEQRDARAARTNTPTATLNPDGSLHATGLEAGVGYSASFTFTPDDGTPGLALGYGTINASSDGTILFHNEPADVNPNAVPGTLTAWVTAQADSFGQPVAGPTTIHTTIHIG